MIRQTFLVSFLLYLSLFITAPAFAKRIALVIGNDDYANVTKLQKAVNDASAIASTLEDTGFQVLLEKNANRQAMTRLLGKLSAKIEPGDEVLFYFSGHGVAVRGDNYLLPIDIPPIVPSLQHSIQKEAFSEDEIITLVKERGAKVSIMIIDACRNNPFPKEGTRSVGRSVGLARAQAPAEGTFIMYSAGIGQEALDRLSDDDKNPNSIFTRKLLPLLKTPGLDIAQMTKSLRLEVRDLALSAAAPNQNHKQFPAYYDQMEGNFYFVPGKKKREKTINQRAVSADETLWKTIENSNQASDFEFYISKFPKGRYAAVAELKIKQLKEMEVAVGIYPDKKTLTRRYNSGDTFKDCDDCPEMVVVPPGEFMMGSPDTEKDRHKSEGPLHKVTISKKFAVGKFEVTLRQFNSFINDTDYKVGNHCWTLEKEKFVNRNNRSYQNPSFLQGDAHPAVCINWHDAKAYVKWLSRKTGKSYRLLTEAEWEYVARANTKKPFWWGDSLSTNQANYDGNHTYNGLVGVNRKKTVAVDSFNANDFGLFNVHGNVFEWVEDCWHENYKNAPTNGDAWLKDGRCKKRVLRGGSFGDVATGLRSASRLDNNANHRAYDFGIRVARTL